MQFFDDGNWNLTKANKEIEDFYQNWFLSRWEFDIDLWDSLGEELVEMGILEAITDVSELSPSGIYMAIEPKASLRTSYLGQYRRGGFRGIDGNVERRGEYNHRWANWGSRKFGFSYDNIGGPFTGWNRRKIYQLLKPNETSNIQFMNWNKNPLREVNKNE